jgi:alpha-1,3/alpha-1,6-mannosyltransferase
VDIEGARDVKESERLWKETRILLSINRFERKKDVGLAIKAYAGLSNEERKDTRLVIAGQTSYLISHTVSADKMNRWLRPPRLRKRHLPH